MPDFRWQSLGGVLLDGNGDLALASPLESLQDMVRTRLKADLNAWQLYSIGADLSNKLGEISDAELEVTIRRQIQASLQNGLLRPGTFNVQTVRVGGRIDAFVYVQNQLIVSIQASAAGGVQVQ